MTSSPAGTRTLRRAARLELILCHLVPEKKKGKKSVYINQYFRQFSPRCGWKRPKFHPLKLLDKDATLAALTWRPVVSDWRPSSWANEAERLVWSARALFPHPGRTVWNIKAKPKKTSIISESVRPHPSPALLPAGRAPQYKHTQPLTPTAPPPPHTLWDSSRLMALVCNCLTSLVIESQPIRRAPERNITFSVSIRSLRAYIMHGGGLVPPEWWTDELVWRYDAAVVEGAEPTVRAMRL